VTKIFMNKEGIQRIVVDPPEAGEAPTIDDIKELYRPE